MKSLFASMACTALLLGGATTAYGQHGHAHGHSHGFVSVGVGFGGHGHGYGGFGGVGYGGHVHLYDHHHAVPYYGSYGSSYPYTYSSGQVYPTYSYPSVVTAPVIQPAIATIPAVTGTTTLPVNSTSLKQNPLPAYAGSGVTLRLPAEFPGSVYVQIDRREVELKPGTEVVFKDKGAYLVEYDRGGEFGTSSGEVKEGVYKFAVGDRGWQLLPDATPASGGVRRNALPTELKK